MDKKALIDQAVDSRAAPLCTLSDEIWGYAETAFREYRSAEAICAVLEKEGFAVEKNLAGIETAFSGTFGKGKPVIGFLGEYDALFDLSQEAGATVKKAEVPGGSGHGCGHNLLGTAALGAAIAFKDYLQKTGISGTVVYFGTPGEECGSGKTFMARDGVFDKLDAAVTWHPGYVNCVRINSSLFNIQASFRFSGVAAHASHCPHLGRSALDAAELMSVGVNYMREHIRSDARVHYSMLNGGSLSPNVVQSSAEMLYLCRSPRYSDLKEIYDWVCDIAKAAAQMTQTQVEITFIKAASGFLPNMTLAHTAQKNLELFEYPKLSADEKKLMKAYCDTILNLSEQFLDGVENVGAAARQYYFDHKDDVFLDTVVPYPENSVCGMGSTDVGDVSRVCPTVQFTGATQNLGCPGHSWQSTAQGKLPVAHRGMLYAAKAMAGIAVDILEQPETLAKAWDEYRRDIGDAGYICPIPAGVKPRPIK